MLIICDFDGTVTASDTNSALARRFAPEAYAGLEGKLASRELTLRDVLDAEFRGVTAGIDAVVEEAVRIPFRAGFERLLDVADERTWNVVLLSSGFEELIRPMLERDGLEGRVPLVANSISLDHSGGTIAWRDLPTCDLCGEPCKRHDVARLRAAHASGGRPVVYVGDGLSDRCGAETADVVFARDSLARYLESIDVPYRRWDDFHDVLDVLCDELDREAS